MHTLKYVLNLNEKATLKKIQKIKGITYIKDIRSDKKENNNKKSQKVQIKLNVPFFSLYHMKDDYYKNYNINYLKKVKEKLLTFDFINGFERINRLDFPINIIERSKNDVSLNSMLILFYKIIKSKNSNQKINISKYINFETLEDTGITLNSSTFEITYYDKEQESEGYSSFKDRLEFKFIRRSRKENNKVIIKNERNMLLELINILKKMKNKKDFEKIEKSTIKMLSKYYEKHRYSNFTTFLHKVKPLMLTNNIYKSLYYEKMSGKSWSGNKQDYNKDRIKEDKIYTISYNGFKKYIDEQIERINGYLNS